MLFEQRKTLRRLAQIVAGIEANRSSREDLMQEALIHHWQTEMRVPGQRPAWYLRSCLFHLHNCLKHGRSVDSPKHHRAQLVGLETTASFEIAGNAPVSYASPLAVVSEREIRLLLAQWLTASEEQVLDALTDGLSAREVAKRLHVSHTLVNRQRHRIALLATKFGLVLDGHPTEPRPGHSGPTRSTRQFGSLRDSGMAAS